ncbi:hypothetical protein BV22DRAFT_485977 [Leucogyrophana mollusca]|uniref:Uncharacterized protein n=1 Tax=Leucogyrophana mollusca TaxID=85980 RepID=A0ACB8BH22_9AGAM|nr:hypothetical protein BV22DRAFT_485977 [Leucogyrophana mollusca]
MTFMALSHPLHSTIRTLRILLQWLRTIPRTFVASARYGLRLALAYLRELGKLRLRSSHNARTSTPESLGVYRSQSTIICASREPSLRVLDQTGGYLPQEQDHEVNIPMSVMDSNPTLPSATIPASSFALVRSATSASAPPTISAPSEPLPTGSTHLVGVVSSAPPLGDTADPQSPSDTNTTDPIWEPSTASEVRRYDRGIRWINAENEVRNGGTI